MAIWAVLGWFIFVWMYYELICLVFVVCKLIRQLKCCNICFIRWQMQIWFRLLLGLLGVMWLRFILLLNLCCFSMSFGIFIMGILIIVLDNLLVLRVVNKCCMIGILLSLLLCIVVVSFSIGFFFLLCVISIGRCIGVFILFVIMGS